MMGRFTRVLFAAAPCALLLLGGVFGAGCSSGRTVQAGPAKSRGHGPPPHAPAHGYRAKTADGADLVFRSDLGVYAVVGAEGVYFHSGWFYRRGGSGWKTAARLAGPWEPAKESKLPPGLRSKSRGKGKVKAKGP